MGEHAPKPYSNMSRWVPQTPLETARSFAARYMSLPLKNQCRQELYHVQKVHRFNHERAHSQQANLYSNQPTVVQ